MINVTLLVTKIVIGLLFQRQCPEVFIAAILFSTANGRSDLRVYGLAVFDRTKVNRTPPQSPWLQQDLNCVSAAVSHLECNEEKGARVKGEGFTII